MDLLFVTMWSCFTTRSDVTW